MSKAIMNALTSLNVQSNHVSKRANALKFRMQRCDLASINGITELTDLGVSLRVYTGRTLYTFDGSAWTMRDGLKCRGRVTVMVDLPLA